MAVSKENADSKFAKSLSEIIASWHKSGELIRLEKKWGLPASEWLQSESKKPN
jgi:polar amino acid transport system substrate-binding protein